MGEKFHALRECLLTDDAGKHFLQLLRRESLSERQMKTFDVLDELSHLRCHCSGRLNIPPHSRDTGRLSRRVNTKTMFHNSFYNFYKFLEEAFPMIADIPSETFNVVEKRVMLRLHTARESDAKKRKKRQMEFCALRR